MLLINTFKNEFHILLVKSDELYDLLLFTVPCFFGICMMINKAHTMEKTKQNQAGLTCNPIYIFNHGSLDSFISNIFWYNNTPFKSLFELMVKCKCEPPPPVLNLQPDTALHLFCLSCLHTTASSKTVLSPFRSFYCGTHSILSHPLLTDVCC